MELVSSISSIHLFDDVTTGGDQGLHQKGVFTFRISEFRDSFDEESQLLTLPTPGIRTSEMESDQWSTLLMIRRSRSLRDFAYRDFGILDVRVLDNSKSRYPKLQNGVGSTTFRRFAFRSFWDSCGEESQCLTPPTPGIRSSEMESDQRSGISLFRISAIRHFDTPVVKCFDTSTPSIGTLKWSYFSIYKALCWCAYFEISAFCISAIQHFGTPMMKCFDTSTPGIRDSEMELFPESAKFFVGVPISGFRFSGFHISQFWDS
jgi:hypothetical protein